MKIVNMPVLLSNRRTHRSNADRKNMPDSMVILDSFHEVEPDKIVKTVYYCPKCKNIVIPDIDVDQNLIRQNKVLRERSEINQPDYINVLRNTIGVLLNQENWDITINKYDKTIIHQLDLFSFIEKIDGFSSKIITHDPDKKIVSFRMYIGAERHLYYTKYHEELENKKTLVSS